MSSPSIITTTHNAEGVSVFRDQNPAVKNITSKVKVIYGTNSSAPVDFDNDRDIAAYEAGDHSALIPKEGTVMLTVEWPPSTEPRMHRTPTLDIGVMITGESMSYPTLCCMDGYIS
jgi:hypothetical protein